MGVQYRILKKIAVLSGEEGGKTKELNIVKWGFYEPSYDIRRWENGAPRKGITLNQTEALQLLNQLKKEFGEEDA